MNLQTILDFSIGLLRFDGVLAFGYLLAGAIVASCLNKHSVARVMAALSIVCLAVGAAVPSFAETVLGARLPFIFNFCIGLAILLLSLSGWVCGYFSPSICAWIRNSPKKRLIIGLNLLLLLIPFAPPLLFYFALKDPDPQPAATMGGAKTEEVLSPEATDAPSIPAPAVAEVAPKAEEASESCQPASSKGAAPLVIGYIIDEAS